MGHLYSDFNNLPLTGRAELQDRGSLLGEAGMSHYAGVPAFGPLRHAARVVPNREAIRYGDQVWSYEQLNHDAVRCAAMLQRMGVRPGDRVGLLLPNVPEYPIAVHGIWRAGGIAVGISPLMVESEVEGLIEATGCRLVICLDMLSQLVPDAVGRASGDRGEGYNVVRMLVSIRERLSALEQVGYQWLRHQRTGRWSLPTGEHSVWFWDELQRTRREWQPVAIQPSRDPAYILPTGGTTGHPKAVTLSHQNLVANAWQQYEWTRRSFAEETMMAVLPFFHSYGLSAVLMGGMTMAASLILQHRFNVRQTIRQIEKRRPTVLHAVPAILVAINERLRTHPANLRSLKWVISGGAPLDEAVAAEFAERTGAMVVEGYGLSEASPVTHVGPLFGDTSYGTVGMPLPETECRIVDIESGTRDVAPGDVGELCVRGPQVMLGYWDDPAATAEVIRDGWLHTGDLASLGSDGLYRIVGRHKDLIITSGFNVHPSDVEEVLCRAEGVKDAAVVGVPDERCGELVKAFVVLEPGVVWDVQRLHAFCRQHLAKHKQPRIIERCEGDLPRNFLGKVVRRHLRGQPLTDQSVADQPVAAVTTETSS